MLLIGNVYVWLKINIYVDVRNAISVEFYEWTLVSLGKTITWPVFLTYKIWFLLDRSQELLIKLKEIPQGNEDVYRENAIVQLNGGKPQSCNLTVNYI